MTQTTLDSNSTRLITDQQGCGVTLPSLVLPACGCWVHGVRRSALSDSACAVTLSDLNRFEDAMVSSDGAEALNVYRGKQLWLLMAQEQCSAIGGGDSNSSGCLAGAGEPGAAKPKRKYTKRAEKWKYTKKAQAQAAVAPPAAADAAAAAAPADGASPAADQDMPDGEPPVLAAPRCPPVWPGLWEIALLPFTTSRGCKGSALWVRQMKVTGPEQVSAINPVITNALLSAHWPLCSKSSYMLSVMHLQLVQSMRLLSHRNNSMTLSLKRQKMSLIRRAPGQQHARQRGRLPRHMRLPVCSGEPASAMLQSRLPSKLRSGAPTLTRRTARRRLVRPCLRGSLFPCVSRFAPSSMLGWPAQCLRHPELVVYHLRLCPLCRGRFVILVCLLGSGCPC